MKLRYDSKIDAIYVEFAKGKYSRTRKISDTILVDENAKGKVLGIEILDASKTIPSFDPEKVNFRIQTS